MTDSNPVSPTTEAKPIYCPRRRQHNAECETPNACAGGIDCRLGPDLKAEEIGLILSARDQFARNIGCERTCIACAASSFTDPCGCLERAIYRVAGEINDAG